MRALSTFAFLRRCCAGSLAALALLVGLIAPAWAEQAVPKLASLVTDQAGMLDADQRSKLEAVLNDYQAKTGSQIAVLTVKSTEPEQIEQYSIRVADAWKLGRKGVDDGVLILVAKDNPASLRRLRIESGRGVQGVLTDAKSKQILQDVIAPYFQKNQFYEGLVAGVGAIATLLNQEQFPAAPAPVPQQQQQQQSSGGFGLMPMILIGIFIIFSLFRPRGARLSRGGWGGNATGFILGTALGSLNRGGGGGFGGGGGGGGFGGGGFGGGGGGSFDGGGASGNW